MKLMVLNDDRCDNSSFSGEHGLSFYIEVDGLKILFDAGQTDVYLKNAASFGVDLSSIDYAVLSHGDYDHGNGLKYFKNRTKLLCHPDCFTERVSIGTGENIGLNQTKQEMVSNFNLLMSKEPCAISENTYFLGQVNRGYFPGTENLSAVKPDGSMHGQFDDSGLVVKTPKGIIVVTGCAHSGICNIVEHAKRVAGDSRVYAVVGGFHMKSLDEKAEAVFKYFKENNVVWVFSGHCNSNEVCAEFERRFPGSKTLRVGMTMDI